MVKWVIITLVFTTHEFGKNINNLVTVSDNLNVIDD